MLYRLYLEDIARAKGWQWVRGVAAVTLQGALVALAGRIPALFWMSYVLIFAVGVYMMILQIDAFRQLQWYRSQKDILLNRIVPRWDSLQERVIKRGKIWKAEQSAVEFSGIAAVAVSTIVCAVAVYHLPAPG